MIFKPCWRSAGPVSPLDTGGLSVKPTFLLAAICAKCNRLRAESGCDGAINIFVLLEYSILALVAVLIELS